MEDLHRQPSLTDRVLGRTADRVTTLTKLAECAEPALVPHLLDFVFSDARAIAAAAARVVTCSLEAASPDDLVELDRICRQSWSVDRWRGLKPVEVSRLSAFGDAEVVVVGLATFHSDGYVREAAVTHLDALGGGRELPFLLVRLNDWVDRVADRALEAVERRVVPAYADNFVDNLPILLRLEVSERRQHQKVLHRIYALLQDPAQREVLASGLTASDRRTRRTIFRLAREAPRADRTNLLRKALRDTDTLIRLEAVADARERLSVDELASVLPAIASDRYPPIRREAVAAAAERLPSGAEAWLTSALMDTNKSVREMARHYLRRSAHGSDFATYYRQRLESANSPRELANAIAGLGETGSPTDASTFLSCLEDERPAVRQASVRALASLDLEEHGGRILEMLRDPVPAVSHTVRKVLRPRAGRIQRAALTSVLRTASYPHSRFDAVALGTALGKWESLAILLAAAADGDEAVRTSARSWLNDWIAKQNRSFAEPTTSQIDAIHTALEENRFAIDAAVVNELRSILRHWQQ